MKKMRLRKKVLTARDALVLRLREVEKQTYRQIGQRLGFSCNWARLVYLAAVAKQEDFQKNGADALSILPGHARRLARKLQLDSRVKMRQAIESGKLSWSDLAQGKFLWNGEPLRYIGWHTWVLVNEWTGLPKPKRGESKAPPGYLE